MPRKVKIGNYDKVFPRYLCNEDCNNCEVPNNRQFSLLINILRERFGDEVYDITQSVCPNMTCCADCHIDDFCHMEECEILDEAEALCKAWYPQEEGDKE